MKTISFFSFKGGVGRTALLMNMAIELVRRGRVVAVMDMDVAAPGLSYSPLVGPCLDQRGETFGVSDILNTFKEGLPDNYQPGDTIETIHLLSPKHLLRRVFLPRTVTGPHGQMVALAAGAAGYRRPDPADKAAAGLIRHISRPAPQEKSPWPILARAIRTDLEDWQVPDHLDSGKGRAIDYLLIDSRTGFDELVDFSLGRLADEMVLVSGLNDQNLRGLSITLEALQQERLPVGELRSQLTVVFSPVPATEDAEVFRALDQGRRTIAESLRLGPHGLREEGPRIRTLHYTPLLALGDRPVTLDHPQSIYAREVAEITELLHSDEDLEARKADVRTQTRKVQETWTPTAPPAGPPTNIYADLPPWHWPFGPGDDEQRAAFEKNLRTHPFTEFDEERFANLLAWSLGLSVEEKRGVLTSIPTMSQHQIDELLRTFEHERDAFIDLVPTERDIIDFYFAHAVIGWATLTLGDRRSGLDRLIDRYMTDPDRFGRLGGAPHLWLIMLEVLIARDRTDLYPALSDKAPKDPPDSGQFWWAALKAHETHRNRGSGLRDLESALAFLDGQGHCNIFCQTVRLTALLRQKDPDQQKTAQLIDSVCSDTALGSFKAENIGCLLDLGDSLWKAKGRGEQAKRVVDRALEIDPNNARARRLLGNVLTDHLGQHQEAEKAFRRAIEIDENNTLAWGNLGNVLTEHLGQHQEAEKAYRRAIEIDENFAHAWNNLGNVLDDHLGQHHEAEKAYRRAIEIDENNAPALRNPLILD